MKWKNEIEDKRKEDDGRGGEKKEDMWVSNKSVIWIEKK